MQDGFYETRLPWKVGHVPLPENKNQSTARLYSVTRKLERIGKLKEYDDVMQDHLGKGVIEPVPVQPTGAIVHYFPHQPVIREQAQSTKMRIVYDCSPPIPSLNDCLETGPSLQPLLFDILLCNRFRRYCITGDMVKAFLQIIVQECDRDAQVNRCYDPGEAADNPNDLGTREAAPDKLGDLWYKGPDWLQKYNKWPEQPEINETTDVTQGLAMKRTLAKQGKLHLRPTASARYSRGNRSRGSKLNHCHNTREVLDTKAAEIGEECRQWLQYVQKSSTEGLNPPTTAPLPTFRTEMTEPFAVTGVDFAGPLLYRANKKSTRKAYVALYTCATTRAVHLKLSKKAWRQTSLRED
ncbi:Hypothetical predicted protein [Paramuricea clavata]|uniref:Uncharacterized protein n=1 Tax=Paramuricea clavata TaxID=317549 RepID=A0A6S7JQL8_PARCT|nr:Hypothetical predicted protein [Paramuricea clavata]